MDFDFRKCNYDDLDFILKLKELCFKWYIEIIYGWDINVQKEFTIKELDEHINDARIITVNNIDVGITIFYEKDDTYTIGMIAIHPDYQNKGIATSILNNYINKAKNENKRIVLKTYKKNPAQNLYKRLGFTIYDEDKTHIHLEIDYRKKKLK